MVSKYNIKKLINFFQSVNTAFVYNKKEYKGHMFRLNLLAAIRPHYKNITGMKSYPLY
jgi:hypothetical protein